MPANLSTDDGLPLFLHDWPHAAPRGTVLIVHGLGEHGGRYAHVAAQLNAWGWRVMAHDHRGHGRSGGERGRSGSRREDELTALALARLAAGDPAVAAKQLEEHWSQRLDAENAGAPLIQVLADVESRIKSGSALSEAFAASHE